MIATLSFKPNVTLSCQAQVVMERLAVKFSLSRNAVQTCTVAAACAAPISLLISGAAEIDIRAIMPYAKHKATANDT